MVDRLIVDDLLNWVVNYKVIPLLIIHLYLCFIFYFYLYFLILIAHYMDLLQVDGFRFDLMGHMMKSTMVWDITLFSHTPLLYDETCCTSFLITDEG